MNVFVGTGNVDACTLKAAAGKLSPAEHAVEVVAESPYEGNTTVGLALLQAGATDGTQTQVSTVIVYAILFII
jgi:hypothetical protein